MPIVNRGPCACCDPVTLVRFYSLTGPGCSNVPFTYTSPSAGYCTSSTNMVKMRALYSDNSTVDFEVYFNAMLLDNGVETVSSVAIFDVPFTYDGKCYKWNKLRFLKPAGTPSYPYWSFPHSVVLSGGGYATMGWVEVACL